MAAKATVALAISGESLEAASAFVGTEADLGIVEALKRHRNEGISKDAATCVFEIKRGKQQGRLASNGASADRIKLPLLYFAGP
jgi:hypothetical protein